MISVARVRLTRCSVLLRKVIEEALKIPPEYDDIHYIKRDDIYYIKCDDIYEKILIYIIYHDDKSYKQIEKY